MAISAQQRYVIDAALAANEWLDIHAATLTQNVDLTDGFELMAHFGKLTAIFHLGLDVDGIAESTLSSMDELVKRTRESADLELRFHKFSLATGAVIKETA